MTQNDLYQHIESNREKILMIAGRHGARNVRIIGSYARGEADCDLDLPVKKLCG